MIPEQAALTHDIERIFRSKKTFQNDEGASIRETPANRDIKGIWENSKKKTHQSEIEKTKRKTGISRGFGGNEKKKRTNKKTGNPKKTRKSTENRKT